MKTCVCGHPRGEHRNGRAVCLMCGCTGFLGYRPPPVDDGDQLALFAEQATQERARIFDALARTMLGLTFEEVVARTGINPNSVRGRLSEMAAERVIAEAPFTRKVSSGRRETTYRRVACVECRRALRLLLVDGAGRVAA